jgi:hypothetical protein
MIKVITLFAYYAVLLIITSCFEGCISINEGNCITPYYQSIIKNDQPLKRSLGTVKINPVEFDEPQLKNKYPYYIPFMYIPILCAIPIDVFTNRNNCFF